MDESFPPPPFEGFAPEALDFLQDLAANQNKVWFAEHKAVYQQAVQVPLAALVTDLSASLAKHGVPLRGDPKRSLFRLNRDVRFSNDKRPYKTHAGAVLTRTGDKKSPGLLYIHIDPEGCFVAAGFYHPEPPALQRLRERVLARPAVWAKAEAALARHGLALGRDDTLVRLPKGFDQVPAAVEATLKLKSWVVRHGLEGASIGSAGLVDTMASFAKAALPLLEFGWAAVDG